MSLKYYNVEEQSAKEKLISAAPSMYEALKEAQAYIRGLQPIWAKAEDLPPVMHTISQALAKAEGKEGKVVD